MTAVGARPYLRGKRFPTGLRCEACPGREEATMPRFPLHRALVAAMARFWCSRPPVRGAPHRSPNGRQVVHHLPDGRRPPAHGGFRTSPGGAERWIVHHTGAIGTRAPASPAKPPSTEWPARKHAANSFGASRDHARRPFRDRSRRCAGHPHRRGRPAPAASPSRPAVRRAPRRPSRWPTECPLRRKGI